MTKIHSGKKISNKNEQEKYALSNNNSTNDEAVYLKSFFFNYKCVIRPRKGNVTVSPIILLMDSSKKHKNSQDFSVYAL